ncbi:MAG: hypothetical protein O7G13_16750 [Alphaproteobacteria bacterium]|nr:hypothetical protein [Alphaproteobacteria bacterium]
MRTGDDPEPSLVTDAVFAGQRYARELDADPIADVPFKSERVAIGGIR